MVKYETGNVLDSPADVICLQVNCQGKIDSEVTRQARKRWPDIYNKYTEYVFNVGNKQLLLGQIRLIRKPDNNYICNMFAQYDYGCDDKRYTSYDAFYDCLNNLKSAIPDWFSLAFPYGIGCARGGADWEIISWMIETVFAGYDITYYYWRG